MVFQRLTLSGDILCKSCGRETNEKAVVLVSRGSGRASYRVAVKEYGKTRGLVWEQHDFSVFFVKNWMDGAIYWDLKS